MTNFTILFITVLILIFDWHNDSINDVEFSESNIRRLLSNINPYKASGPDFLAILHFSCLLSINYPITLVPDLASGSMLILSLFIKKEQRMILNGL